LRRGKIDIGGGDRRAFRRHRQRYGAPNSATGSGDQGDLVLQHWHVSLPQLVGLFERRQSPMRKHLCLFDCAVCAASVRQNFAKILLNRNHFVSQSFVGA
jgi:hypothetical protein